MNLAKSAAIDDGEIIMEIVFGLIFLVALFGIPKLLQQHRDNTLKDQVTFVSAKSDNASGRYMPLMGYVIKQQDSLGIESDCSLRSSKECSFAEIIISDCAKKVNEDYLNKRFEATSALSKLTSEEFFFSRLYLYLWDFDLKGYPDLLGRTIWNTLSDSEERILSEDGVAFYKLLYIACSYCQRNSRVNCFSTGVWITTDQPHLYRDILRSNKR